MDGLMDGEAIDAQERGEHVVVNIKIADLCPYCEILGDPSSTASCICICLEII
jgi:hypothetical protein